MRCLHNATARQTIPVQTPPDPKILKLAAAPPSRCECAGLAPQHHAGVQHEQFEGHSDMKEENTAYPIGLAFSRSASSNCLPVGDNGAMADVVAERGSEAAANKDSKSKGFGTGLFSVGPRACCSGLGPRCPKFCNKCACRKNELLHSTLTHSYAYLKFFLTFRSSTSGQGSGMTSLRACLMYLIRVRDKILG